MNKLELTGKLTRDPEVKHFDSGKKVVNLSLAQSEKKGEEWVSIYHDLEAWGKPAEYAEKFKKGDKISVVGKLIYREYDKNGVKIKAAKCLCFEVKKAE